MIENSLSRRRFIAGVGAVIGVDVATKRTSIVFKNVVLMLSNCRNETIALCTPKPHTISHTIIEIVTVPPMASTERRLSSRRQNTGNYLITRGISVLRCFQQHLILPVPISLQNSIPRHLR